MSEPKLLSMTHSVLGEVQLHLRTEPPTDKMAFGYIPSSCGDGKLTVAIWRDGKWRDRNLRPIKEPVPTYYRMRKPDGSPFL